MEKNVMSKDTVLKDEYIKLSKDYIKRGLRVLLIPSINSIHYGGNTKHLVLLVDYFHSLYPNSFFYFAIPDVVIKSELPQRDYIKWVFMREPYSPSCISYHTAYSVDVATLYSNFNSGNGKYYIDLCFCTRTQVTEQVDSALNFWSYRYNNSNHRIPIICTQAAFPVGVYNIDESYNNRYLYHGITSLYYPDLLIIPSAVRFRELFVDWCPKYFVSSFIRDYLLKEGKVVEVLYEWFDPKEITCYKREKRKNDEIVLLYGGRFATSKNVEFMLDFYDYAVSLGKKMRMVICTVGSPSLGTLNDRFNKYIKSDRIEIIPDCSQELFYKKISESDISVCASVHETVGRAWMEKVYGGVIVFIPHPDSSGIYGKWSSNFYPEWYPYFYDFNSDSRVAMTSLYSKFLEVYDNIEEYREKYLLDLRKFYDNLIHSLYKKIIDLSIDKIREISVLRNSILKFHNTAVLNKMESFYISELFAKMSKVYDIDYNSLYNNGKFIHLFVGRNAIRRYFIEHLGYTDVCLNEDVLLVRDK